MKKEIPMDELTELAKKFCTQKYRNACLQQTNKFNEDHFRTIVSLCREAKTASREKWDEYLKKAKGSRDVQMAIILNPNVPSYVVDNMFKRCTVYASVCKYAFFTEREDMSKSVAQYIYNKINIKDLDATYENSIHYVATPEFANILIRNMYDAGEINDKTNFGLFVQNAFKKMSDNEYALKLIADNDVPEFVITSLCDNVNLPTETRVAAYERGIDYFKITNYPEAIVDELYKNATYTIFGDELNAVMTARELRDLKLKNDNTLQLLIKNELLNGGQTNDLWNMSIQNPIKLDILCAIAKNTKDEKLMDKIYDFINGPISKVRQEELLSHLMQNTALPEHITTPIALKMMVFVIRSDDNDKNFGMLNSFFDMLKRCAFSKEMHDMIYGVDVSDLKKSTDARCMTNMVIENKECPEDLLDKFEDAFKTKVRFAKEIRTDEKFREFYQNVGGVRSVMEIFPYADDFRENIKRIYAEELEKDGWGTETTRDDYLRAAEQDLVIFGLKEPTKKLLNQKISSIIQFIQSPPYFTGQESVQALFYQKLDTALGPLEYFGTMLENIEKREENEMKLPEPESDRRV